MEFYTNISILQRNKEIDKIFYKMDIDKNYFCNNSSGLRERIIGIIYKYLLPTGDISYKGDGNEICFYPENLKEWYSHMDEKLNDHLKSGEHKEGYIDGCVKDGIERSLLEDENTGIVAGLDTPVWIGNPKADTRIMIVSQDPRRNIKEMAGHSPCISLSSPFGWHDKDWRNNGRTGLLPQICWEIIQELKKENDKNVCFYFTDLYKLRKANTAGKKDNSTVDKKNKESYLCIIEEEINVFSPTHIVLMGSAVCNTPLYKNLVGKKFDKGYFIPKTAEDNPKTSIVPILHIACRQSAIEQYKKDKRTLFKDALKELANNKKKLRIRACDLIDFVQLTFEKNGIETIQEVEIKNEEELHKAVENADCDTLVAVEVWCQGIRRIGQTTFQALPQLRSVSLPSSVKKIDPNAFRNCHNLQEVNLRGDVQRIEVRFGCYAKQTLDKPFNGLAGLLQTGAAASIDPDDSWSHWD